MLARMMHQFFYYSVAIIRHDGGALLRAPHFASWGGSYLPPPGRTDLKGRKRGAHDEVGSASQKNQSALSLQVHHFTNVVDTVP